MSVTASPTKSATEKEKEKEKEKTSHGTLRSLKSFFLRNNNQSQPPSPGPKSERHGFLGRSFSISTAAELTAVISGGNKAQEAAPTLPPLPCQNEPKAALQHSIIRSASLSPLNSDADALGISTTSQKPPSMSVRWSSDDLQKSFRMVDNEFIGSAETSTPFASLGRALPNLGKVSRRPASAEEGRSISHVLASPEPSRSPTRAKRPETSFDLRNLDSDLAGILAARPVLHNQPQHQKFASHPYTETSSSATPISTHEQHSQSSATPSELDTPEGVFGLEREDNSPEKGGFDPPRLGFHSTPFMKRNFSARDVSREGMDSLSPQYPGPPYFPDQGVSPSPSPTRIYGPPQTRTAPRQPSLPQSASFSRDDYMSQYVDYGPETRSQMLLAPPVASGSGSRTRKRSATLNYLQGEDYYYSAGGPQVGRRPHWLGPRTRKAFEAAGLLTPVPRDVTHQNLAADEHARRLDRGLSIERSYSALAHRSEFGYEGVSGEMTRRSLDYRIGERGWGSRNTTEREFGSRPGSRLDRDRQYTFERARSPGIGNDSLTPSGSVATLRPESSFSNIFSRRREGPGLNRILSFSRRDRDLELSRGESPTSTVISGTTANSYSSSARAPSRASKTHMGRSASVSTPSTLSNSTDTQKRVAELEAEIKTLKEKHTSELAALLNALGDSQETVRELRAKVKELEAREVNMKTKHSRSTIPPATISAPVQAAPRNHTRKPSTTSSVFQTVPDDVSLLLRERPSMGVANLNGSIDGDAEHQGASNESMDKSGSSSRPPSPTLVLPNLLQSSSATPVTNTRARPVPNSKQRTEVAKTHEANSSISTTGSTLSEWEMQEGNSLKLRPEHAMFLEDVLDSSMDT